MRATPPRQSQSSNHPTMSTSATAVISTPEPYGYRLKAVAKVVDGDTVDLDLDLGFSITLR